MARYANIVSFDDAKAASRRRRVQESAEDQRLRALSNGPIHYDLSRFAGPEPSGRSRNMASSSRSRETADRQLRSNATTRSERSHRSDFEDDATWQRFDSEDMDQDFANTSDSREQRRRQRNKAKADRMFSRQFADDAALTEPAEGAPRAALYEGKMGSSHRRAARMQLASSAGSASAKINPAGWFSGISVAPGKLRIATALVCVVMAVVFLYTPAQHYYQSVREHDRLAAEYASIEERNAVLSAQNVSLASDAGMEDAVRQKYGYVSAGEETAMVSGLSDEATADKGDGVEANVLSSSVKAPEEWYTPYLDALFGVS